MATSGIPSCPSTCKQKVAQQESGASSSTLAVIFVKRSKLKNKNGWQGLLLFTNFLSSDPKCTCKLFVWNNSSHTAETLTRQFQKESWSRQFQKRRVGRFFSHAIQILPSCVLNTWVEHQQSSEWVYIWLSSRGPCFHRLLVFSRSQPLDGSFYQTQHLLWCPIFHRNWKYLFCLTTSFSNCPGRWWFVQHDNIFLGSSLQVQSRRTCSNFCSNFCRLLFFGRHYSSWHNMLQVFFC